MIPGVLQKNKYWRPDHKNSGEELCERLVFLRSLRDKKAKSPESDSPSEMLVLAGDEPEGRRTRGSWVLVRGNVASDWGLAHHRPTLTTGLPGSSRCGMYEVRCYFSCPSYEKISMRWGKQRVESVMLGWLSTVTVGQKKHQRQKPDGAFISSMGPSLILLAHSNC